MDLFEGRIPLAIRAVNMEILLNTRFALLSLSFLGGGHRFSDAKIVGFPFREFIAARKKNTYFLLYWLVSRYPYNGFLLVYHLLET